MIEYDKGETIHIDIQTRDEDDILTDVISVTIDITNEEGTTLSTGLMTKEGTGKYKYDYTISSDAETGSVYMIKSTIDNGPDNITIKKSHCRIR